MSRTPEVPGKADPTPSVPTTAGARVGGRLSGEAAVTDAAGAPMVDEPILAAHLIGIGGAGMSGIARLLLARGVVVSGSDNRDSPVLAALRAGGAAVFIGHRADQVPAGSTVVISSAVRPDNPELVEARDRGLKVLHRSQALAALMTGRRPVAIAGTHGKTTTTGMTTVLLRECGLDPSFAIGGELTEGGQGAHDGAGDIFVAEADESDGSFLLYKPEVAVITNVEPDHLDHYGSQEAVEAAFAEFAQRVVPGGMVVVCGDDPGVRRVLAGVSEALASHAVRVCHYGLDADNDVRLVDVEDTPDGVRFAIEARPDGTRIGPVTLRVPGVHNALNAVAAWCVARHFGVSGAPALTAVRSFGGTRRRFEDKGTEGGVRVVDDYAHHPTEVRAVLKAARAVVGQGRVLAVFQPHLFSRTRIFAEDFGAALSLADEVVVLDVYAAREDPEPGVTGELVTKAVRLPEEQVAYRPTATAAVDEVVRRAQKGDLVLTLGAGDVTALGPAILEAIRSAGDGEQQPA
ncbi:UDP-N-acetylmuramate--L-alanine ligase [Kineosporia succinea]|uniref:UDP-N-acetylmuramate--L-alanine ligase n=1 Tax=Kineosporia succinea TaxID=84632 RepID=A0ABT9P6W3_9ACTN|nr:UDP-N-acetylmuramate--L-alanine ligase [Kineosporia succinea]MDP9828301.1 UDP-N-acetylmuramate--alanine ligase [Kineosporia succinea]